jgi:hypothetical protein
MSNKWQMNLLTMIISWGALNGARWATSLYDEEPALDFSVKQNVLSE